MHTFKTVAGSPVASRLQARLRLLGDHANGGMLLAQNALLPPLVIESRKALAPLSRAAVLLDNASQLVTF